MDFKIGGKHGLGDDPLEYFEGDTEMNDDRSWGWIWLPVVVLGYLVILAFKASMVSIFDDD